MQEPIENEYFNWLCAKVLTMDVRNYVDLMRILHQTEFTWDDVIMDRNRAADGCELRYYFLNETGWISDPGWYNEPCSILEMLIAFSEKASFQTEMPAREWFWIFMRNLCLEDYRQVSRSDIPRIERILHTLNWRTYDPNGQGGLFPLRWLRHDQTELEIWYQFCAYLEDQGIVV